MRWFLQALGSDFSSPRLCCLLLYILPSPSSFTNLRHSHHTGSSTPLGIPCLLPSISIFHMSSFTHLGVARLHLRIPITHPDFLSLPVAVLLHSHLPNAPPSTFRFLQVFQGGLKLFSRRLLAPPHLHPPPPSFITCLPCTYLK